MSRTPVVQIVSAMVVAVLLAACVPQGPQRQSLDDLVAQAQQANAAPGADGHDHSAHDHGDDAAEDGEVSAAQAVGDPEDDPGQPANEATTEATPAPAPTGEPSAEPAATRASDELAGPTMEQHDDFPITATLSAACVERGGEMMVRVDAGRKNTGVVYIAIYEGEESGAPPPYGDGHGGNSGDMTDNDGYYEDTWVVSPDAPVGAARVEVMAGRDGMKSTTLVRFEVVGGGSDGCDG